MFSDTSINDKQLFTVFGKANKVYINNRTVQVPSILLGIYIDITQYNIIGH